VPQHTGQTAILSIALAKHSINNSVGLSLALLASWICIRAYTYSRPIGYMVRLGSQLTGQPSPPANYK